MFEAASQAVLLNPALTGNAALLLRGGASVMAATVLSDTMNQMIPRGGAAAQKKKITHEETILGLVPISPEGKSALFMAIAMACHYLGYSLARPITVALFTSSQTGYISPAAFPFAMAFVSPAALGLLVAYNKLLEFGGPRGALTASTLCCAFVVSLSALLIHFFDKGKVMIGGLAAAKLISGPLFVFRESYVQLLTSQYWSFMASVLTPNQSAVWFGPIAGITSIASAVAGYSVTRLVAKVGLIGGLLGTALSLLVSLIASNAAYGLASKYDFTPSDGHSSKSRGKSDKADGLLSKAQSLFERVPVLKALFQEILSSQGLATVLNVIFVARVSTAIPNDIQRAGWVGNFYASINVVTMALQFGVLPVAMRFLEPRDLWRLVPIISFLVSAFQSTKPDPTLAVVSASLFVMKVSEYSVRRMLDEMVYVPLDFDSRFVGKEVLGVFGYRFGKSLMSLGVSGVTSFLGDSFGLQQMSFLSTGVALTWLGTAWKLSNMVPTRAEAESAHAQANKGSRRRR